MTTQIDHLTRLSFSAKRTAIFTLIGSDETQRNAAVMIASLRAFGGRFKDCPVWVFTTNHTTPHPLLDKLDHTQIIPLELPGRSYFFQAKVRAGAQAETRCGPEVRSLIWMNPQCLIVKPPEDLDLAPAHQAALRTVHIQNIGSPIGQPLDEYWQGIYRAVGLEETQHTLISYVDSRRLRPYINSHLYSIDPAIGLLRQWRRVFEEMIADRSYQSSYCADAPHKVFLHQAVLSALVLKLLDWESICWLPPSYSYPLHFHSESPQHLRPAAIEELVCPVYEGPFQYPDTLNGLAAGEPLNSWLAGRDLQPK